MNVSFEDIKKANEQIRTLGIKHKDMNGKAVVKEYAEVNQRIKAFRMVYPQGFITTSMESNQNGVCIFVAKVGYEDEQGHHVIGTGTAYEKETSSFINKTSYIENCETSAVGRALGMAGFGIDTSVASAEEVQNAIENQEKGQKQETQDEQQKEAKETATPEQVKELLNLFSRERITKIIEFYKVEKIDDIPMKAASKLIEKARAEK